MFASPKNREGTSPRSDNGETPPEGKEASEEKNDDEIPRETLIDVEDGEAKKMKETEHNEVPKLWTDIISGNRVMENGMQLSYVAPKKVDGGYEVEIEDEDVEEELKYWESALIMYVIGGELSMNAVKNFMIKFWNFIQLPEVYYNDEGYFILRFKAMKDKEEVLKRGPYTIQRMTMFLIEWKEDFSMEKDMMRTLPIWIKLPQLPIQFWGKKSLEKIGSMIGKPMFTDECTANKLRVSYARILVEVDITQKMVDVITINKKGQRRQQKIKYEWKPLFCERCQKIGHRCTNSVNTKQGQRKQWSIKSVEADEPKTTTETTIEECEIPEASHRGEWNDVNKRGTGKKRNNHLVREVHCENGFGALEIGNDHLGPVDNT